MHDALLGGGGREEGFRRFTEAVSRMVGVERVSVWRFTGDRAAIEAVDLFEASRGRHSSGQRIREEEVPAYFHALGTNQVLAAHRATTDPRTREFAASYLEPNGIASMLDAPVLLGGELGGVVCLEQVGESRRWTAEEQELAISVANVAALLFLEHARTQAEERLKLSEQHLRAIIDHEPECVKLVSPAGRVMEMNPAGLRMLEAADEGEVVGRPLLDLVHPDDREAVGRFHRSVARGGAGRLQFRIVGLRGTERWMESHSTPMRDSGGAVTGVLSVTRDISERVSAERELRESRRRLQALMDHLPGMAYRCRNDPDWTMEVVSAGVRDLTGHAPEAFLPGGGVRFGELIHPEDRDAVWVGVQEAIEGRRPFRLVYRIRTREGEERWVWEQGEAVDAPAGAGPIIEGLIIDITEQKRLERQLVESQKMESVGRLAGGIAHDFNNLLSVILGTVDLALAGSGAESPMREDLLDVRAAAERAAELTRQLLAFGRRQPMQTRVVDLNALLDGISKLLRRLIGEDVEMIVSTDATLPPVRVDPGQVEQVLTNLVTNARDAMPDGGILRLETREVPNGGLPSGGPAVEVSVRDTGTGMPPEVVARIFEPFFTTKAPGDGTGLGLAMVYGLVQQNGGRVAVESRPGEGTTFRILLPVAGPGDAEEVAAIPGPAGHAPGHIPGSAASESILLVEDEERLGRVAERILAREGYAVLRATRGEEALRLMEQQGPVDLLVTDVVMPGLSGPQVADAVLERYPGTRVLFTSGYPRHHAVGGEGGAAAPGFLPKPYTREGLLEAVWKALHG